MKKEDKKLLERKKRESYKCAVCKESLGKNYRTIIVHNTIKDDFKKFEDYGFVDWEIKVCDKCDVNVLPHDDSEINKGLSLYRK